MEKKILNSDFQSFFNVKGQRGVRGQRLGVLNVGRPPLFIEVLVA